ncbi:MAG: DinB family protein [Silvibacterium sp.]|nr:DinB family protein [Silvibacterium sp.]
MIKRPALLLLISLPLCALAQNQKRPTDLKGVLLEELRTTHNEEDWFVPANIAVQGMTAEQAKWSPGNGQHSVGQLVYHLVFWNTRELADVKGEKSPKFSGNNDETFNNFDDKQWNALVKQLDDVLTEWEKAVEAADDAKIAASASLIAHTATHNAYHIGQIVYVRKLQGSWDASKGVK